VGSSGVPLLSTYRRKQSNCWMSSSGCHEVRLIYTVIMVKGSEVFGYGVRAGEN